MVPKLVFLDEDPIDEDLNEELRAEIEKLLPAVNQRQVLELERTRLQATNDLLKRQRLDSHVNGPRQTPEFELNQDQTVRLPTLWQIPPLYSLIIAVVDDLIILICTVPATTRADGDEISNPRYLIFGRRDTAIEI